MIFIRPTSLRRVRAAQYKSTDALLRKRLGCGGRFAADSWGESVACPFNLSPSGSSTLIAASGRLAGRLLAFSGPPGILPIKYTGCRGEVHDDLFSPKTSGYQKA
jgi:hypothetical protein